MMYRLKVDGRGYVEGQAIAGHPIPTDRMFLDAEAVRLSEVTFGRAWATKYRPVAEEMVDALRSMGFRATVEPFDGEDAAR